MTDNWPTVTVIIPTRPELADIPAVTAARDLIYPPGKLDVLVARGKQPSIQRNVALREARGELIYFLDDDSLARPENLQRAVARFHDPKVQIVGGPNVCPDNAPALEQVFALVLSCWLAFGPSRARYAPVGAARESGEKELILCNLVARRAALLELGGFNEALYPNEENALMDELQKRGGKLIYDPDVIVERRPRQNLKAFCKMLFTYGRGRAEQFRATPTPGSILNFAPPLLLLYLVMLPVLVKFLGKPILLPLVAYGVAVLTQVITIIPKGGELRSLAALPLIILTHLLYGLGFWRGLGTRLKSPDERSNIPVKLERV